MAIIDNIAPHFSSCLINYTMRYVMSDNPQISFSPANGDWFVISREPLGSGEPARISMERLIGWSISIEGGRVHVEGVSASDSCGVFDHIDHSYVFGDDVCPNGKTWRELYNDTPHYNDDFKVLSKEDLGEKWKYETDR